MCEAGSLRITTIIVIVIMIPKQDSDDHDNDDNDNNNNNNCLSLSMQTDRQEQQAVHSWRCGLAWLAVCSSSTSCRCAACNKASATNSGVCSLSLTDSPAEAPPTR